MNQEETRNRIRASILAQAMGDAMGYAVEFDADVWPSRPKVTTIMDVARGGVARFSDDTQMAHAVGLGLLDPTENADVEEDTAQNVARRIVEWYDTPLGGSHRAPGGACSLGARNMKLMMDRGELHRWREAGKPNGKGCGIAMRSAPFGWLLESEEFAAECALQTHRSPCAQAQGAAMCAALKSIIQEDTIYDAFAVAQVAADAAAEFDMKTSRDILQAMYWALDRMGLEVEDVTYHDDMVFDRFRGWRGDEAIAGALYAFLVHPNDLEACLALAANTPGDSDSLAAIAGAIAGAFIESVPDAWAEVVECRDQLLMLADRCVDRLEEDGMFQVDEDEDVSEDETPASL